jgi:hypothetical protein
MDEAKIHWVDPGISNTAGKDGALKALAAHGYAGEARFAPLLEMMLKCQDGQGRWLCGPISRTRPIEKRNRPVNGLHWMRCG